MSLWGRAVCVLWASIVMVMFLAASCLCVETPALVSTGSIESGSGNASQIVRTSTGRLYHFSANGVATGDGAGWIDVHASVDGQNWVKVDSSLPCFPGAGMAVAIDAVGIIHMITYDGSGHPSYQKFNSADSSKGDHTWEGAELIDKSGAVNKGRCAIAIDANGIPHLLYQLNGTYEGKNTTVLAYANRIGGVWNMTVLSSRTDGRYYSGPLGIAVGPDNLPHIHMGTKILRGNANNPDFFETKEFGEAYSFVIHQNGDVRVALASKGMYANQLHDHTQPWDKGWTLTESSTQDKGGVLVLAEDMPWLVTLEPDGLRVKREFEPSRPAVAQQDGHAWKNLTARWSFYNHHSPWMIDMGTGSWDAALGNGYWYGRHVTRTVADFSVAPATGLAPLSVLFGNGSMAADGQIITLNEWDFENNGTVGSIEANPIHLYDKPGTYSARLTVTDSAGATDTKVMRDLVVVDDASLHPLAAVAALSISTSSLPAGTVGSVYSKTLAASGGTTPYTWSKTSGSLPAGLALSSAGVISGTPTTAATSSFTVQVKDKNAKTATKPLSITINPAPLTITTTSLADGYIASAYSKTLAATGGKTAYTWSIISGELPAGLSLVASTGIISGTPTASGTNNITVQVKDANNTTTSKSLAITVYAKPSITTSSFPAGTVGTAYSQTLSSSGGKPPIVWSISSGTLPAGLSLNANTGNISGTPTTNGTSSVTFMITDANAKTAAKTLSITINAAPPSIATSALIDGYIGSAYSQTLAATGGKSPYTWSKTSGTLPAGLSLSSAGVISGSPTTVGASSFTVQVKDANNLTATKVLAITVNAKLVIGTSTLSDGYVAYAYNQPLLASGGRTPYTWSITSGALPAGLNLNSSTGTLSGMPTAVISSSFTVQVKDANNIALSKSLIITVKDAPLVTAVSPLPNAVDVVSGSLTATFNGPMNPATITNGSFTVSRKVKVTKVAAGGVHTVVLKDDGTVAVWGDNSSGISTVPPGLLGVVSVAAGAAHTVALKNDGTVVSWGYNSNGQTSVPEGLSNVVAIAAGDNHTVALRANGTVVGWGDNNCGQATIPTGLSGVVAIAAGPMHTVALKQDGTVVAWGLNNYGQTEVPSELTGVVAISAGYDHTVAVKNDGSLISWGKDPYQNYTIPAGLTDVVEVATGSDFEIALKRDGTITSWGWGMWAPPTAPAGLSGVIGVSAGVDHVVAVKNDGTVVLWGRSNDYGQTTLPVGISGVVAVAAGREHALALKSDGTVASWETGLNMAPTGLSGVTAIAAGDTHSLALKNDGRVVAWGDNNHGEINVPAELTGVIGIAASSQSSLALKGDGTVAAWGDSWLNQSSVPAGLSGVISLAAGDYHAVALKNDGTVVAWGLNSSGQATVPAGLSGVVAIAAGENHTVALKNNGTMVAWGANDYGQSTIPAGLSNIVAIAAGSAFTAALKTDGTVVAWGLNDVGQTTVPAGLFGVTAISARSRNVLALKADGTVVAWGDNTSGQATIPSSPYETPLSGSVSWNPSTLSATFVPDTHLPYLANIKAVLGQGIRNQIGAHLPYEVTWSFTTVTGPTISTAATLRDGYAGVSYNGTLSVNGGASPYIWTVSAGSLPGGLTLDSSTGIISGIPTATGNYSFTIQVKDTNGVGCSKQLGITVYSVPMITTSELDGFIGTGYYQSLKAAGGKPPYTWTITSGSLPAGLNFDAATATISGNPVSIGSSSFVIQVADSNDFIVTKPLTINIVNFGTIFGTVTDQSTGNPLSGVTVTLSMTDIKRKSPSDIRFSCYDSPIAASEYAKIEANDDVKIGCYGHYPTYIKVRNPYGTADPFTVRWNGLSAYTGNEYIAQSFKPTKSGGLNRVSFHLARYDAVYGPSQGEVYVLLKSALGGERGIYLAHSAKSSINSETPDGWVDFDLTSPVSVTAGQQYFLELQGNFPTWEFMSGDTYYDSAVWGNDVPYADGNAYQRSGGIWKQLGNSLTFRTYVDNVPDIITQPPHSGIDTHGAASFAPNVYIHKNNNSFEPCAIDYGNNNDFYADNNSGDFNCTKTVINGSDYYDQDGWITVELDSSSSDSPATALVTDQFSLTFNRTSSAVTDANGTYSFPGLPDGSYTVTYGGATTSSGVLKPGEHKKIDIQLPSLPPMVVNITSPSDRTLINSTGVITVSGVTSSVSTVSVNGVRATVTDNTFSATIPLAEGLNTITATASNLYGQTASTSITVIYNATPRLSASAYLLDFGSVPAGVAAALNVTLSNISSENISMGITTTPVVPFSVISDECSGTTLVPTASCRITAQFAPTIAGAFAGELAIPLNGSLQQHLAVKLSGTTLVFTGYILPDTGQAGETARNPLKYTVNSDSAVTDDNTELMWQRAGSSATMTWTEAGSYCKNLTIDGYSGWRLPNPIELTSIVNYGVSNPSIDQPAFPVTYAGNYWSSKQEQLYSGGINVPSALSVDFAYGELQPLDKTARAYARCVRGQELSNSFVPSTNPANNQTTIYDQDTGLTWFGTDVTLFGNTMCDPVTSQCRPTVWADLSRLCYDVYSRPDVKYGGYQDWRLPTVKELAASPMQGYGGYWSATSSTRPDVQGNLTQVYAYSSDSIVSVPKNSDIGSYDLRCVRGGNLRPSINSLNVSDIGMSAATVHWSTNLPASGVVEYGESSAYGSSSSNTAVTAQHAVTLSGLQPATAYHYRIVSTTANGIVVHSEDQSLVTAAFSITGLPDTGNVSRVEFNGSFDSKNTDGSINVTPRQDIAKEYIRTHGDTFDFLVFLSTFDYALPESEVKGFYLAVKNDVQGINQPIFDNSAQFGSASKLQGTIDLGNVTSLAAAPFGPKLDETVTTLNHELMHRFGAHVRYKNPDGTLNTALIGKDSAHWSYLLDTQGSIMYGNGWKDNGDGTFTSTSARSGFSSLDLYLMGMIPKEQVPPMLLIDNPSVDKTQLPQLGATISGTAKTVTIDDIIAAECARVPDSTASQKKFNVGFVLLSRPGDNTTAATQAIEMLRKAWAGRFAELTGRMGGVNGVTPSVSVFVDSPSDGVTVIGPDVTVTGSVINSTGAETGVTVNGIVAAVTGSRFIANHVPLQSEDNPITITATDVNGLTATATKTVTAQAGNYIRISSTIESGVAPLDVSLRLDGSFIIANPAISASGPASITLTPGASATGFTTKLIAEGTYTITASAVGPDGKTYTDSVTITVQPLEKINALLISKWGAMKTALTNGDVASTMMFFNDTTREKYRSVFQFLSGNLPTIAAGLRQIEPDYIRQDVAEYRISQPELINPNPQNL